MEEKKKEFEEQKKEEKKKNNTGVIIILCIIIILLLGYIAYSQGVFDFAKGKKEEKTQTEEKMKEEEKEPEEVFTPLTEEEARSYYIISGESYYSEFSVLDLLNGKFARKYPMKMSDLSNQDVLQFVYRYISPNKRNRENIKQEYDEWITKIFGKDFAYQHEDIQCFVGDGPSLLYDAENEKYVKANVNHPHGGSSGEDRNQTFFVEASKSDKHVIIKTKVLYSGVSGDTTGPIHYYFSKPGGYEWNSDVVYTRSDDCMYTEKCEKYEDVYPVVQEQLPITTFIYDIQSDGNYGLSEITVGE